VSRPPSVAAVDVGGTTMKGAVFTAAGDLVVARTVATFGPDGSALTGLLDLLHDLVDAADDAGLHPSAIGISSPGVVDAASGTIAYAANLGWRSLPLARLLEEEFAMPVAVEHDARSGAQAELTALSGADAEHAVFLPIGTGIGAAMITNGAVVRGATGAAGEVGHIPVVPGGEPCACGQLGCLEVYASAAGIRSRYLALGGTAARTTAELAGSLHSDPRAAAVWDEAVDALAAGIVSMTATLDPAVVVIGGGLGMAGDTLLLPLRRRVQQLLTWRQPPRLLPSAFGPHSSIVGVALLALDPPAGERRGFATRSGDCLSGTAHPVGVSPR
jgi:glucokinase